MYSYNYATERNYRQNRPRMEIPCSQQLNILIIDDNIDFANTVTSLFNRLGYIAQAAYDKETGIDMISEMNPDLIFCDIGLPSGGGYEIANRIKSERSENHAILVALTGYSHEKIKLLVMELGFDFYISKPIQSSILQDVLQKVQTRKKNLNRKKAFARA